LDFAHQEGKWIGGHTCQKLVAAAAAAPEDQAKGGGCSPCRPRQVRKAETRASGDGKAAEERRPNAHSVQAVLTKAIEVDNFTLLFHNLLSGSGSVVF
jgi:hypothetical protein